MAVAIVKDYPDATLDQYDALIDALELGGRAPAGVLFHWATKTPAGVRTVEIWCDEETHDAYVSSTLAERADAAGLAEPTTAVIPVHHTLAAG